MLPLRPGMYGDDPMWYKYNLRYNLMKGQNPGMYPEEYDFYWQKKQAERVLKSGKSRKLNYNTSKSFSNPNIRPKVLPPIINPYVNAPAVGLAAAKLELDG